MATIYLCIGTMKTGTTTLQNFMRNNPVALGKQGFCYPVMNRIGLGSDAKNRNGHFLIFESGKEDPIKKQAEEAAVKRRGFQKLKKLSRKYPSLVLSEELIWHHSRRLEGFWPSVAESVAGIGCQLKVIVYLRRQDQLVQSLWSQGVKTGMQIRKSFHSYIRSGGYHYFPLDYYSHLKKIEESVGKGNIWVRVYENGQFGGSQHTLLSDYLDTLGLRLTDDFKMDNLRRNPSLGGNFLEIKRFINRVPEYRKMGDFLEKPMVRASVYQEGEAGRKKQSLFEYRDQAAFLKKYEEGNRKIAEEFLGRGDGILFREPLVRLPAYQVDEESLYSDLLVSATEVFVSMQQEIAAMGKTLETMEEIGIKKKD